MGFTKQNNVPVLILGGVENTLSIVRSLSRVGIPVGVSASSDCSALYSKYCKERHVIPSGINPTDYWGDLLLGGQNKQLTGQVIFACNDYALEFLAGNQTELEKKYVLEENIPNIRTALLDKQKTLLMAESAGCPAPKYWRIRTLEDVERIKNDIELPAIIKPVHSHIFVRHYNKKLLKVNDAGELLASAKEVLKKGIEFMICEFIPGPDNLLCSYYTYNDESGNPLFHFTKRIIRRYPVNFGGGCYHITEWNPETAAMGETFFQSIGLRGLGNIEFKRDPRDNKLKVIECNARFTAAQELLYRSGMDIALFIYNRLTGNPLPKLNSYNKSLRLWYPSQDYGAYRELRKGGNITFAEWIKSISHRQVLPCFDVRDPAPWVISSIDSVRGKLRKILSTA